MRFLYSLSIIPLLLLFQNCSSYRPSAGEGSSTLPSLGNEDSLALIEEEIEENPEDLPAVDDPTLLPKGDSASFAEIRLASKNPIYEFSSESELLAEFISQRPQSCLWTVDSEAQTVSAVEIPTKCSEPMVQIAPSGGNDTQRILDALQSVGPGGCLEGNGQPFQVSNLRLNTPNTTIINLPMVPANNQGTAVVISGGAGMTWINSPINGENKDYNMGHEILESASGITLIKSGVSNLHGKRTSNGGVVGIRARGTDDIHISCSKFENILNTNFSVRGIHIANRDASPRAGLIANNVFNEIQSTNGPPYTSTKADADGIVFQGLLNFRFSAPMQVLANRGVDMGKRFLKLQSGNVEVHGNDLVWAKAMGPLGRRTHQTMIGVLGMDDVQVTNNKITYEKGTSGLFNGYTLSVTMNVASRPARSQNVSINNNLIIKDSTSTGQGDSPLRVSNGLRNPNLKGWPTNLEIKGNVIMGEGAYSFAYAFIDGDDRNGDNLELENTFMGVTFTRTFR